MDKIAEIQERVNRLQREWRGLQADGHSQVVVNQKRVELLNAQAVLWEAMANREMRF